ncbi:hypothetical protein [Amycolatopsis pigmentata]|uniref:PH domain-containing protein n=1 Tax=Amycolatopsis pigmentata TaxID=450801 RepID=A0ABW5FK44_9PSEU
MSAGIDAGAVPSREEIVVYEPREDVPAGEDPWIGPLVRAASRRRRSLALWSLPLVVVCVYVLVEGRAWAGVALPAVLALFFALRFSSGVYGWYMSSPRSRERLLATPLRKIDLGEGDLRATKRAMYARLADGQWFRFRPSSVYVPLLARRRYVWVLGPDSAGRVIVFLPGMVQAVARRVEKTPPAGAESVVEVAARTVVPKDDPVVQTAARFNVLYVLASVVPSVLVAGWFAVSYVPWLLGPDRRIDTLPGIVSVYGVLLAVFLLWTSFVMIFRLRRLAGAARAVVWTPLRITVDSAPRRGVAFPSLTGRCTLPDDTLRSVELRRVSANIGAAIEASGVLWVAGTPRGGGNAVGVPGHPFLGVAKLGPAKKP